MADKLDLHYLVALMSGALPGSGDDSLRRFNPLLHTPKHGIVDNPDIHIRTFPVLDALAHISISQERFQVVAIALQSDYQNKKIHLTVAENKEVSDSLVAHLTSIWRKLQNLSGEYEKRRTEKLEKVDPLVKSPPIPPKVAISLKIEIFRDIYKYSFKKQMWRIEKWWEQLGGFMAELLQYRGVNELEGLEGNLYSATVAVVLVAGLVSRLRDPKSTLTDAEWEAVYLHSMQVNSDAKLVLDIDNGLDCEALALEIHCDRPNNPFPLRRALEKLTSLPRHIESLIGLAHSPRLRPALEYTMSISPVPNQPHNVQLPTSRAEWKSFLETTFGGHQCWQEAQAVKLSQKLRLENYECPVHCECALIQYHQVEQHNHWDNIPVFRYIGVSKLSCGACRTWIETFNEQGGPKFYTRGSHGKWYWPWGVPKEEALERRELLEEAEESLEKKMARKVYKEYLKQMRLPDPHLRMSSDSTDASSSGAEHTLADDDLERSKAVGAMAVQKSGGSFGDLFYAQLSYVHTRQYQEGRMVG